MPRRARLDLPNLLHHVMARGIEGGVISGSARTREEFLRRLSHDFEGILEETCKRFRVSREQILNGSRARDISRAGRIPKCPEVAEIRKAKKQIRFALALSGLTLSRRGKEGSGGISGRVRPQLLVLECLSFLIFSRYFPTLTCS